MSFRSPLSRAKGLGSAKEGVGHWWMQRLTALALVPLLLWLVFAIAMLGNADYATMINWLSSPFVVIVLTALILALFYHSSLGIQVVVEDYISHHWARLGLIVLVNFINVILVIISIFAILKIAFGAHG